MKKRFKIGTALALSILFNIMPTNIVDVKAEELDSTTSIVENVIEEVTYYETEATYNDYYSIPEEEPLQVTAISDEVSTAEANNIVISEPANAPNPTLSDADGEVTRDEIEEEGEEQEVTHKVTIHIWDNRSGSYAAYKDFTYEAGSSTSNNPDGLNMFSIFGLGSRTNCKTVSFVEGDYTYTFAGWYLDSSNINEFTNTTGIPNDSFSTGFNRFARTTSASYPNGILMNVNNELNEDVDVYLYANWEKTETPIIRVHIFDTYGGNIVETSKSPVTRKSGGSSSYHVYQLLDKVTVSSGQTFTEGNTTYTFDGWYDEEGNKISTEGTTIGEATFTQLLPTDTRVNGLKIASVTPTRVSDINIYAHWNVTELPDGKVTIHFYDSMDEDDPVDTGETLVVEANTQSGEITLRGIYGFDSKYEKKIGNVVYEFMGLYDSNGVLIDEDYVPQNYLSELHTFNPEAYNYKLIAKALDTLEEDQEINVYAKWQYKAEPHTITINYYGVKGDEIELVKTVERVILPGTSETSLNTLDQIFSESNEDREYTGVRDENSNTESDKHGRNVYTFIGWYDAPLNGTLIDENYQVPDEYKNAFEAIPAPAGTTIESRVAGENPYEISYKTKSGLDKDYEINFYAYWDTFVTPILNLKFINNVSYDENISWTNTTGGTSLLDYELREPSDPPAHYEFMYWVDEDGTPYETGHYLYDFTDKESGFEETVIFYAVWQPSVTLNVYGEESNTLIHHEESTIDSGNKVVLENDPTGYNYSKPGYDFAGYFMKVDGEEVDVAIGTEFTAPEPTTEKVTQLIYNVYSRWVKTPVTIEIYKEFDDENADLRPESIDVVILADEEELKTVSLSEEGGWHTSITLEKYRYDENGENPVEIIYSVREKATNYYNSSVESEGSAFTITNTLKEDGYIVVKHIDVDADLNDNILLEESYHDTIDKEYHTSYIEFDNYELVETPDNADGVYTDELQEIIYKYQRKPAKVIVHYMDKFGNPIIGVNREDEEVKDFDLIGKQGLPYDTTPYREDIVGYRYLSKVGYETGVFESRIHEVTYIYEIIDSKVIVHHINNVTEEEFKTEYIDGVYGDNYETTYVDEVPYEVVLPLPENASGTFGESDIHVTYYYDVHTGIVEVHYKDIDDQDNDLVYVEIPGVPGEEYSTEVKEFEGYKFLEDETVGQTTGIIPDNDKEVVIYYYKKLGTIIVNHIDMYTNEVIKVEEHSDMIGEVLTTSSIEKEPYFLVTSPENENVTYQIEDVVVNYYYNRNGKVDVYYVDTDNKLLYTTDITDALGTTYETEARSFDNYNLIMVISDEDNNATSGIITDYNKKVTYIYEVIPEEVKTSMIIVKYVSEETEKEIAPKDYIRGNVGDEYTVTFKEVNGYEYSGRVDGEEFSTFTEDVKTITYYYTKVEDEDDDDCDGNCCCHEDACTTCPYGLVITRYEDEDGNTIHEQNVEKVTPNGQYTTSKLIIDGYEFVMISDDSDPVEGVYVENEENKPIIVTYVYKETEENEVKDAHLIVKYVEGNNLLDKEVISYKIGDFYFTTRKQFDGYIFVDVDHDEEGYITDELTTIIYTYEKVEETPVEPETQPKDVTILVQYLDSETNNPVYDSVSLTGKEGETYTIIRRAKDGYNLLEPEFDELDVYTESKILTYYYEKVKEESSTPEKAYVLVHYVDSDRNPIISDDLVEGFVGNQYVIPTKVIPGYNLVDIVKEETSPAIRKMMLKASLDTISKDNIGVFGDTPIELYFIYEESEDTSSDEESTVLKPAMLIVHHVDVNGAAVAEDVVTKGFEGDFYNASQKVISGYKYVSVDAEETNGILEAGQTVITFTYEKLTNEDSSDEQSGNCDNCCQCNNGCNCGNSSSDDSENNQPIINIDININNENNSDNHSENNNENIVDNHADNHNDNSTETTVNNDTTVDTHNDINNDNSTDVSNDTTVDNHNDNSTELNNDNHTDVNNENNNQDETNVNIENNPVNTNDVQNNTNVENNPTNTVENNTEVENNPTNNNESSSTNTIEQNPSITNEGGNNSVNSEVNPTISIEGGDNTNTSNIESNPTINVEGGDNSSNIDNSPVNDNNSSNINTNTNSCTDNCEEECSGESCSIPSDGGEEEATALQRGILVVNYLDEDDKTIAASVITMDKVGEYYASNQKDINGYEFDKVVGDTIGKYDDNVTTVNYYYKKLNSEPTDDTVDPDVPEQKYGTVVVRYFDNNGDTLLEEVITRGKVNDDYVSIQKAFDGYRFLTVAGNRSGKYVDGVIEVSYFYEKLNDSSDTPVDPEVKYGNVNIYYVDVDGNEILESVTWTGQVGVEYESSPEDIEGYSLVNTLGDEKGTYEESDKEIIYVYERLTGRVIAHYVDTNHYMIGYDVITSDYVGEKYSTKLRRFKGYTLIQIVGDTEGEYTKDDIEVTYIYQLNESGGTQPSIDENDSDNGSYKQSTPKSYGIGHTEISVPNTGINKEDNNYLLLILMLVLNNLFLIKIKYQ